MFLYWHPMGGSPAWHSRLNGWNPRTRCDPAIRMFDDQGVYPLQGMVGVVKIDKLSTWYHLIKLSLILWIVKMVGGWWWIVHLTIVLLIVGNSWSLVGTCWVDGRWPRVFFMHFRVRTSVGSCARQLETVHEQPCDFLGNRVRIWIGGFGGGA